LEEGSTDQQHLNLLKEVFNPHLSDRRGEAEAFVGPDLSDSYMAKLEHLVAAEGRARQHRLDHFASTDFRIDAAGPLFPPTWTSSVALAADQELDGSQLERCLFEDEEQLEVIKVAAELSFDRNTEDGLRFRIYRHDSGEVRTTTGPDGKEVVRAAFSLGSPDPCTILGREPIAKVTHYVCVDKRSTANKPIPRYYLLLELCSGMAIVTEKLANGTVVWEELPPNLARRLAGSKVMRSVLCGPAVTVSDIRQYATAQSSAVAASDSEQRKYAEGILELAGEARRRPAGVARVVCRAESQVSATKATKASPDPVPCGLQEGRRHPEVILAAVELDGPEPPVVQREEKTPFTPEVKARKAATGDAHEQAHRLQVGDVVKARFTDDHWFLATLEQDNGDGTYELAWLDGDTRQRVKSVEDVKLMRFRRDLQRYEEVVDDAGLCG